MVPGVGLDASFSHILPLAGDLAFVSQSGGMITAVLDWAAAREIGFSHVVSLGDMVDVDFGDMLDYLAADAGIRAILLYIEAITHARKFMSAARAAADNKPVLVVKVGRFVEEAREAASRTGALADADAVYEAAFRRAGMLRLDTMADLFDAVETLALTRAQQADRLAVLTNGGGPGYWLQTPSSPGAAGSPPFPPTHLCSSIGFCRAPGAAVTDRRDRRRARATLCRCALDIAPRPRYSVDTAQ
jgi:acetyltransferase